MKHGTSGYVAHKCRCDICKAAQSAYMYEYRRRPGSQAARVEYDRAYNRRSGVKAKERARARQRRYGLTPDDYATMLTAQGNACAICRTTAPGGNGAFHVDHDHATGQIRGLLCFDCNTAVGKLGDNLAGVLAAADYLIRALVSGS